MRILLICIFFAFVQPMVAQVNHTTFDLSRLENSVKQGDLQASIHLVETFFHQHGYSQHDSLVWSIEPHTTLYNYYNPSYINPVIFISAYPTKKQVWEYWGMWSKYITNDRFNARKYFKSSKRALRMAKYNVLMILSHEYGHHLADRYGVKPNVLNAHEFVADLASMALVESFPHGSELHEMQEEYTRLLTHLNALVDDASRFNGIEQNLFQDQSYPPVVFPKDTVLMTQYASAYFVRRIYLHSHNNPPKSDDLFDSLLRTRLKPYGLPRVSNVRSISSFSVVSPFDYTATTSWSRSITRYRARGGASVEELKAFGFDANGQPVHLSAVWPRKQIKEGILPIELTTATGKLLYRWHCQWDSTQSVSRIKWHGFQVNVKTNELTLLTSGVGANGERSFMLYESQEESFTLKSRPLPGDLQVGNHQLMHSDGRHLLLLNNKAVAGEKHQFYAVEVDMKMGIHHEEFLFEVPGSETWTSGWSAWFNSTSEGVLAKDQFLFLYRNGEIKIASGTGLEGNKQGGAQEFYLPKAVFLGPNTIGLIDLLPPEGDNRNRPVYFIREMRFD